MQKKTKKWEEGLKEIEAKYIEFFKKRPPLSASDKHDKITNHVFTYTQSYGIAMGYHREELPEYIKVEIAELFKKVWQ